MTCTLVFSDLCQLSTGSVFLKVGEGWGYLGGNYDSQLAKRGMREGLSKFAMFDPDIVKL